MSRQSESLRGHVEARKAEAFHLGEGKSSLQGRLGGGQEGSGLGWLAVTVQQVLDEERRVLGRSLLRRRRLRHGRNAELHEGREKSNNNNEQNGADRFPNCFVFIFKNSISHPESVSKRTSF